jgi:hypothetical protein
MNDVNELNNKTDFEQFIEDRNRYTVAIQFIKKNVEIGNMIWLVNDCNCKNITIAMSPDSFKRLYTRIRLSKKRRVKLIKDLSALRVDNWLIKFQYKLESTTYTFCCTHPLKNYTITDAIDVHKEEMKLLKMLKW